MDNRDESGGGDSRLLAVLAEEFDRVAQRAGEHLVCRAGCSACCHGPFPVTRLDVRRLQAGLTALRRADAVRAAVVEGRASESRETLRNGLPGDPATGRLDRDEAALDRFFARHQELACPVLDPATGRCELYAHRPVACRTFGPPLDFGSEQSPPCRLCFTGATAGETEACRMRPDPDGLERKLLDRMGVAPEREWETLIAFAVAPEDPGAG